MTNMDIESGLAAFFEQDHRDCDARWADVEELLDNGDIKAARPAWEKYQTGMFRHIAMEEDVLFPAFDAKSDVGGRGATSAMRLEHQQMRSLLEQIGEAMDSGNTQHALDIGDTLLMLVQQHSAREERMLYPMAQNMLAVDWARMAEMLAEY